MHDPLDISLFALIQERFGAALTVRESRHAIKSTDLN
jgi:hypothetical protein